MTGSPPDYAKEKIVERYRSMSSTEILDFIKMVENLLVEGKFGLHSIDNIHCVAGVIKRLKDE
jgi:hypothetical protein|tara:strand:+ start:12194 stop:12382 length:189 start_codon:yes stop_codon:yes gene_type:complete